MIPFDRAPRVVTYPLTSAQETLRYADIATRNKNALQICAMIHIDAEVDVNILTQAVLCALLRQKSSCMRLRYIDGKLRQYFYEGSPEDIRFVDFSGRTQSDCERELTRWREEKSRRLTDRQLYFVRLLRKPDGNFGVFLRVSHYCFDAYALLSLGADMLRLYEALKNGDRVPPLKSLPLRNVEEDEKYKTSPQRDEDIRFWRDEFASSEPLYTAPDDSGRGRIEGKRYGKAITFGRMQARQANFMLPAKTALAVVEYGKAKNISPQCLYLFALGAYLSAKNGAQEDLTVLTTVARRGTLSQKRAGGCRMNAVPFRMSIEKSSAVSSALVDIYERQAKYFAHSSLPTHEILGLLREKFSLPLTIGYHCAALIYQPYGLSAPDGLPVRFTVHSGFDTNVPLCVTIMPQDTEGNLCCSYIYQYNVVDDSTPSKLHAFISSVLEKITSAPDTSVEELVKECL